MLINYEYNNSSSGTSISPTARGEPWKLWNTEKKVKKEGEKRKKKYWG